MSAGHHGMNAIVTWQERDGGWSAAQGRTYESAARRHWGRGATVELLNSTEGGWRMAAVHTTAGATVYVSVAHRAA